MGGIVMDRSDYCRGLRFDKIMHISTDNISGNIIPQEYIPHPPPVGNNFLLLDGTPMLLLDGENFELL